MVAPFAMMAFVVLEYAVAVKVMEVDVNWASIFSTSNPCSHPYEQRKTCAVVLASSL